MSLETKAKTKGELAFDMISYLINLQNTGKIDDRQFRKESSEKWVQLEDAQKEIRVKDFTINELKRDLLKRNEKIEGLEACLERVRNSFSILPPKGDKWWY